MNDGTDNRDRVSSNETQPEILDSIVEDFTERLRSGEHPPIEEYQQQHPEFRDEIEDLLASVVMIEKLKTSASVTPSPIRRSLNEVSKLDHIAHYEIKREIGRGGMGVVFEAVHESLGRTVAIKVMPTPIVDSEKYIRRFKREAKAAAKLHHTNIVGVFEVGDGDRFHYYVMDFVDGEGLNEIVRGLRKRRDDPDQDAEISVRQNARLPGMTGSPPGNLASIDDENAISIDTPQYYRWVARIGANLADALAYAHSANILHRDIKPSNMILDRKGTVWITDFGLAKDISGEINLTKTGDVIGTPQYLAPESLEGSYDQRSEVYCLGLTLYELATLDPAYKPGSTAEVLRAITSSRPASPRKLNRNVPIDLSEIIDKAIEKSPGKRYQSADEMKNDLFAFIQDRPVSARPPSTTGMVLRWWRRRWRSRPVEASLLFAAFLLLITVPIFATMAQYRANKELQEQTDKATRLEIRTREVDRLRTIAEKEIRRADTNIEITLRAFDELYRFVLTNGSTADNQFDVDTFQQIAGLDSSVTDQDALFAERLISFYEQFVANNSGNSSLKSATAMANRRVANIYQLIGQYDKASESYQKSRTIVRSLLDANPGDDSLTISLAQIFSEQGRNAHRRGHPKRSEKMMAEALNLIESLSGRDLGEQLQLELIRTTASVIVNPVVADISSNSNRLLRRSVEQTTTSIAMLDKMIEASPENVDARSVRTGCLASLALALRSTDPSQAKSLREKAIDELSDLMQSHRENPSHQYRLAVASSIRIKGDSTSLSRQLLEQAVDQCVALSERFPLVLDYHQLLAASCAKLTSLEISVGRLDAASKALEIAIQSLESIADNSTQTDSLLVSVMRIHRNCVELVQLARNEGKTELSRQAANFIPKLESRFKINRPQQ